MNHRMRSRLALGAVVVVLLGGCASADLAKVAHVPGAKYRIAIAQISQETNSFSPIETTLQDFEAGGLYYGDEVVTRMAKTQEALSGFMKAVSDFGAGEVEVAPILRAVSNSGGPVQNEVYERFKRELIDGLEAVEGLSGVYLALHGAMGVEGMFDPEGDLLQAIRDRFGPDIPVGVSFDLHANVTQRRAELATFIVGFKTNPHRDSFRTGYDSGKLLVQTVQGKIHPVMVVRKMRLLKGGGMNIDFLAPMNTIFSAMKRMERQKGILSVSNFMVHFWLDDPELGWSTVAVTDGDAELAAKTADALADMDWAVRDVQHPKALTASEAVAIARKSWLARKTGCVVVCDVADTTSAGAPGENTWILKALVEEGPDLVSYIPLRDAQAAIQAFEAGPGAAVELTVGGKLEKIHNRPYTFTGTVLKTAETSWGKTAIVKHDGVHLILTELPAHAKTPDFFTNLGLSLWKADLVVVKNLFPFRYNYMLYNRKTLDVETPGTTSVDVFSLKWEYMPRPIYPLDMIDSWR